MKTLLKSTLVLLLAFTLQVTFASESPTKKPEVYEQLSNYLQDFPTDLVGSDTEVRISFMITSESEIVVLKTSSEELDKFVKRSLNYKKLVNHDMQVNTVYVLPVKLRQL